MARFFSRSATDYIRTTIGSLSGMQYGTMAAIVKRGPDNSGAYVLAAVVDSSNTGGGIGFLVRTINNGSVGIQVGGTINDSATGVFSVTDWQLLVATKGNGSVSPRAHIYNYATHVWSHFDVGGAIANSGATSTRVFIGTVHDPLFDRWDGDIAVLAAWSNRALSDAETEMLPFSLAWWFALAPSALWVLDQSSTTQTVVDLVGTANQDAIGGTAVSTNSVPVFSYGHSPIWVLDPTTGLLVPAPPVGMQIIG